MSEDEAIKWLINLRTDIGKSEHRALWHYEQALAEIIEMLNDIPHSDDMRERKDNE